MKQKHISLSCHKYCTPRRGLNLLKFVLMSCATHALQLPHSQELTFWFEDLHGNI